MGEKVKIVSMAAACLLMVGCTSPFLDESDKAYDGVMSEVGPSLGKQNKAEPLIEAGVAPVRYVNRDWLPVQKVDAAPSPLMDAQLNRQVTVNRSFRDISEFSSYVSSLTGVPIYINSSKSGGGAVAVSSASSMSDSSAISSVPAAMRDAANPIIPPLSGDFMDSGSSDVGSGVGGDIAYTGSMSGLLDLASAKYKLFWEWDKGTVVFFATKSKMFRIVALPGATSLSSSVGNESAGGGSSSGGDSGSSGAGGSSMSSSSEMSASVKFSEISVWEGIEKSINAMLSPDGKLAVTPSTGTIIVHDTPPVLSRVSDFVNQQNLALSRQVVINVRVLSVNLTDNNSYGIDWNAVYKSVGSSLNVGLANGYSGKEGSTNLTFSVLSGSPWGGSSAIINALSKQGKVSQVTSASVVTMNNQLAPFQVGRKKSYLASSSTTISNNTSTTSLQPGQIVTGFSMNVLPHVLDDKRMLLQYSADLSSLLGINEVTSGTSKIQTPEVDTRNFLQRVMMNSGETLVVTGFEQFDVGSDTQGIGGARNVMLGGGMNATQDKAKIVVLIQPVLSGRQ